jgi:type I restriction enzyme M protein
VEVRKKIIEENRLDGVVSMPSGVFKPYAGVSTAVLFLTRGAQTKDIWFYDMAHDGFSLDDKRVAVQENDVPDIVACWKMRFDKKFREKRDLRIGELRAQLAPLKWERLGLHEEIDEMTFVKTLTENMPDPHPLMGSPSLREREPFEPAKLEKSQTRLAVLEAQIKPLQNELEQLSRQFWVTKEQVKANKYDLSASRYRQVEADDVYHPRSHEIIDRLLELSDVMNYDLLTLQEAIDPDYYGFRNGPERPEG